MDDQSNGMVGWKLYRIIVILLLTVGSNSSLAYAYLDPGSGSMILQLLIGGLGAAAIVLKMRWYKIKSFFSDRYKKSKHE